MVEAVKAREAALFNRTREAARRVKAHFEDHPNPDLKKIWKDAPATQSYVLSGVSLALAAQNQEELAHLISGEIRKYKGPSYINARPIFDDNPSNQEILQNYFRSKPKMYTEADRIAFPVSERREEELAVGKDVLRKLEDVMFFPVDDFKQSQAEAAKLIAQLSLTVNGQFTHTHQNLRGRMFIVEYLVNNAMGALVPQEPQGSEQQTS